MVKRIMKKASYKLSDDVKIGVIGLGLIGGSVAKAYKARTGKPLYIAVDRNIDSLRSALGSGCVKRTSTDVSDVSDCDIVFICVPVSNTVDVLDSLHSFYKGVVTDTTSTKSSIYRHVAENCPGMRFIGGHPMAGSDKTGFNAASDGLFENAPYIICESKELKSLSEDLEMLETIVEQIGAVVFKMDAKEHDRTVGLVSHLPHVVAYALVDTLNRTDDERLRTIAAGGFKDITRIVSSDPVLWADILSDSGQTILKLIEEYSVSLHRIAELIADRNKEQMTAVFSESKTLRDSLTMPGHEGKEYVQIWVDIDDRPGMIATAANIFAEAGINIRNISIQDSREYEGGSLRVTVLSVKDAEIGADLLRDIGLSVRVVR